MARRKAAASRKTGSIQRKSRGRRAVKKRAARKKTAAVARASRTTTARRAGKARGAGKARRVASNARRAGTPVKTRSAPRKASTAAKSRSTARPRAAVKKVAVPPRRPKTVTLRKPPSLDRARRIVMGDDIVPTPPSSLDLDRTASAARTGRRELRERLDEHTETGPAMTAGDVDADWESAYSVGDEAPGGDNPTPDQDIVDDIGRAVGNEYQDTEELKGADKIARRDKHRWELDPASSEDYDDRD